MGVENNSVLVNTSGWCGCVSDVVPCVVVADGEFLAFVADAGSLFFFAVECVVAVRAGHHVLTQGFLSW